MDYECLLTRDAVTSLHVGTCSRALQPNIYIIGRKERPTPTLFPKCRVGRKITDAPQGRFFVVRPRRSAATNNKPRTFRRCGVVSTATVGHGYEQQIPNYNRMLPYFHFDGAISIPSYAIFSSRSGLITAFGYRDTSLIRRHPEKISRAESRSSDRRSGKKKFI